MRPPEWTPNDSGQGENKLMVLLMLCVEVVEVKKMLVRS